MNPRVPLTVAFLLALAPSHAVAQQPPKAGDAVEVAITPPTDTPHFSRTSGRRRSA